MEEKRKVGRPLKFQSVEELERKIDEYFGRCDAEKRPYTVSGLAYALDTSRRVLLEYQDKDAFRNTITRAKAKIETFVEESLWQPKIANGVAFNLKNNFGWKDQQAVEFTGKDGGPIVISRVADLPDAELEKLARSDQPPLIEDEID